MPSTNQLSVNSRSMNGLNTINANAVYTDSIEVGNLQIDIQGTAPTRIYGDNTTNIATTQFVQNAVITAGGSFVDLSTNQTINGIKNFVSVPTCSTLPTANNMLANKQYVDSLGISTATNNVWTGTNNFKDVVYINNPSATKTLTLKSTNQNITMTTGTTNQALSGVSFNCNTITVPVDNTENLINITIPFNITGLGGGLNYPAGTIDLTYSSFTVNVLKNGSSYSGSSPSATFYNYDTFIRSWSLSSSSVKYPIFSALLGNISIPLTLDIGNTSTDIYTINLTVNGTATHTSGGIYTLGFYATTTGNANFTTTNYNNTSATFLNSNPSYIPYSKLSGDNGIYLSANNTLNFQSSSTIEFLTNTNFNNVLPQSTLTPLNNADLATKLYIDNAISQAISALTPSTNPIGTIIMMTTSTVPTGYLYCDGTTYNTTTYAGLWSVIFYTYGGSGSNFKVPDYRGCFIRGFGSTTVGGITYNAPALGTVQQDAVLNPLYCSNQGFYNVDPGGGGTTRQLVPRSRITTDPVDTNTGILPRFDRTATENRPINQSIYYYIKY